MVSFRGFLCMLNPFLMFILWYSVSKWRNQFNIAERCHFEVIFYKLYMIFFINNCRYWDLIWNNTFQWQRPSKLSRICLSEKQYAKQSTILWCNWMFVNTIVYNSLTYFADNLKIKNIHTKSLHVALICYGKL